MSILTLYIVNQITIVAQARENYSELLQFRGFWVVMWFYFLHNREFSIAVNVPLVNVVERMSARGQLAMQISCLYTALHALQYIPVQLILFKMCPCSLTCNSKNIDLEIHIPVIFVIFLKWSHEKLFHPR